jgi:hypothetical protein
MTIVCEASPASSADTLQDAASLAAEDLRADGASRDTPGAGINWIDRRRRRSCYLQIMSSDTPSFGSAEDDRRADEVGAAQHLHRVQRAVRDRRCRQA